MRGTGWLNVADSAHPLELRQQVEHAIEWIGPGPTVVPLPMAYRRGGRGAEAILHLARSHGFVPMAAAGAVPASGAPSVHHHTALVVAASSERASAVTWAKALARVSPRSHVVLVFAGAASTNAREDRERLLEGRRDDERLRRLIAEARFEEADAWLSALRVEAVLLRGGVCRDRTLVQWTWLRVRQARYEEARRACGMLRSAGLRRTFDVLIDRVSCKPGATCTRVSVPRTKWFPELPWRWRQGATMMHVLHAIPTVLQLVAEADDELMALRGAAAWARRHAGAQSVAFVGGDDGRLIAADGWAGTAPTEAERLAATRAHSLERHARGPAVLIVAPVRYAGVQIGGLAMTGPAERAETLTEAVLTLTAVCAPAVRARLDVLTSMSQRAALLPEIVGRSPAMVAMRDVVARAAATPFPVLVEGESGTGKELVARALHRLSARRDRRFAALNCAALSDDLVEAELFGHTRGAFTGAVSPRAGLFEEVHGGVLFLDEVAELSPRAQAKLLRVLQEREIRRVGENTTRTVDVRVVAATNRSLADACGLGQFRHDLLFRLAVIRIRLPALRERAEDIALLAQSFWRRAATEVGKRALLGADALARLASHRWPGNVRELQNIVAGLAVIAPVRGRVGARHVDQVLNDAGAALRMPPMSLERARHTCERQTVAAALARHAGRRGPAARELGLTRQGLTKAMRRLHIHEPPVEGVA